ncbi:hypothetical protein F5Y15DRAFT_22003 [Xylariaceae sp. FL0016]|nr:hypothetical protein F5Y15DRAFT_22003 [Xylariaceae sp. FL0016]
MAPKVSNTSAEPTLYEILSLTPKSLEGQTSSAAQKIIKHAYHKALLKNHPDKNQAPPTNADAANKDASSSQPKAKRSAKSTASSSSSHITYSVDQIQHAYSVLGDARQRSQYNKTLFTASRSGRHEVAVRFHTGVETVDLDDVDFDERKGVYYRQCRCGNARGYAFRERDLEAFEDDGVLMVECLDCSLWLRVLFSAAAESEEDEAPPPAAASAAPPQEPHWRAQGQKQASGDADVAKRRGGNDGKAQKGGRGFKWSFGISLGGGVSASANTSTNGRAS